jgi:hypothetical protein
MYERLKRKEEERASAERQRYERRKHGKEVRGLVYEQLATHKTYKQLLKSFEGETDVTPDEVKFFSSKYIPNKKEYYLSIAGSLEHHTPWISKEGYAFDSLSLKVVSLHLLGYLNLAVLANPKTTNYFGLDIDTLDTGVIHAVREAIGYPPLISCSYKEGKGYHLDLVFDISHGSPYTNQVHNFFREKLKAAGLENLLLGNKKVIELLPTNSRAIILPLSHNYWDEGKNGYYLDNDLKPIGGLKESLNHLASYPSPRFSDLLNQVSPQLVQDRRGISLNYRCIDSFLNEEGFPERTRHFAIRGTINALLSHGASMEQVEQLLLKTPYNGDTPYEQHKYEVESLLRNQYNRSKPYGFSCTEFRSLVTNEYCSSCPKANMGLSLQEKEFNPLPHEFLNILSFAEQVVYRAHVDLKNLHTKTKQTYYASIETIARMVGGSPSSIKRAHNYLEELELLEKISKGYKIYNSKGIRGAHSTYRLVNMTEEQIKKFMKIANKKAKK